VIAVLLLAWLKLSWNAPGDPHGSWPAITWTRCAAYEVARRDPFTGWAVVPLYRDSSLASSPPLPAEPFAPDSGYVQVPSDEATWRAGGSEFRLRSRDDAGNWSEMSNRVVGVVADRDTTFFLKRWTPQGAPLYLTAKAGRSAWFALAAGDEAEADVVHLEDVNRDPVVQGFVCGRWGFWLLRGLVQPCPGTGTQIRRFGPVYDLRGRY